MAAAGRASQPPVCSTCKQKPAEWTTGKGDISLCGTCFRTYGHETAKAAGAAAAVVPGEIELPLTSTVDSKAEYHPGASDTESYDSEDAEVDAYIARSRSNSGAEPLEDHSAVEDICECERCTWVRAKYGSQ